MGTSGRGTMGPSGDWAKAGEDTKKSAATQNGEVLEPGKKRIMRAAPRCRECTQFDAKWLGDVAGNGRDSYNGCSLRRRLPHVRNAPKVKAATRSQSATSRSQVSGKHAGTAAAHPGGIHQSTGAIETRGDRGHDRDVRVGAARFA